MIGLLEHAHLAARQVPPPQHAVAPLGRGVLESEQPVGAPEAQERRQRTDDAGQRVAEEVLERRAPGVRSAIFSTLERSV